MQQLPPPAKTAIADIETTAIQYDGGFMLIPDVVHLLVAKDYERGITYSFGPDKADIERGVRWLETCEVNVFHNGFEFDALVLEHHYNYDRDQVEFQDSIVLLQLFHSDIKEKKDYALANKHAFKPPSDPRFMFTKNLIGKHALEAWCLRLSKPSPKGDYSEKMKARGLDPWAEYNAEMHEYAIQDVEGLSEVYREFIEPYMTPANAKAVRVELFMQEILTRSSREGIKLDVEWARKLADDLTARLITLEGEIAEQFPPRLEPVKWVYTEEKPGRELDAETKKVVDKLTAEANALKKQLSSSDDEEEEDDDNSTSREIAESIVNIYKDIAKLWEENGVDHVIPPLAKMYPTNKTYRPQFNLPANYRREMWGEVFEPKVNRTVKDKEGNVVFKANVGEPYVKVEYKPLKCTSRPQIIRRLLELGWHPTEFTKTGNPKTSEVELHKLADEFPAAEKIATYMLIQKRLGAIKTGKKAWLNLVDSRGFIHPRTKTCATVAFRAAHSDPNVSQVASVKTKDAKREDGTEYKIVLKGEEGKWGWDSRRCFTVPKGFTLVGSDLAGIELRCWAHYLWPYDNGHLAYIILNQDVHEENRKILGFSQRRDAKTFLYACVPMDTQALTRRGWKRYDELVIGEDIMTYNPSTKQKEWQPLLELVKYDSAPVTRMYTSKGFDVRSTGNHRWFTNRRTGRSERYYVDEVVTTDEVTTEHMIIRNAPLGDKSGQDITIADAKYGPDWCSIVANASSSARRAFLQGFLLADGSFTGGVWRWSQLTGEIAEALLIASYLETDVATHVSEINHAKNPMICAIMSKKGTVTGQRLRKESVGEVPVWCPRTANGSWVMRQGNCITITGNTMYGAGMPKLGSIIEPQASLARKTEVGIQAKNRFIRGVKGYQELDKQLARAAKRGFLTGLDGRRVPVRKQHAALNSMLQSAGAIISKYWLVFFIDELENTHGLRWGYDHDYVVIIYSHDEYQTACRVEHVEAVKAAYTKAAERTQAYLKFKMPIDIGLMVGDNWGDTH